MFKVGFESVDRVGDIDTGYGSGLIHKVVSFTNINIFSPFHLEVCIPAFFSADKDPVVLWVG